MTTIENLVFYARYTIDFGRGKGRGTKFGNTEVDVDFRSLVHIRSVLILVSLWENDVSSSHHV